MRRIRYAVAASLDGYIAGPDGEADWIVMDPEIDFSAIFAQFDTMIMGRRTFEPMARVKRSGMSGMKVFVFSRTLKAQDHPGVTIVGDNWQETLTELRNATGKDIWLFGGASFFASLLDAGFVDTVEVAVIPVLLGGGLPLLAPPARRATLQLDSHTVYEKTGIVGLNYSVKKAAAGGRKKRVRVG